MTRRAMKEKERLPSSLRHRVDAAMQALAEDLRTGVQLRTCRDGGRLRVGKLRIIYRFVDDEIVVERIRSRDQAYAH